MERLTKWIDENHVCYAICQKECPDGIYKDNPACMCTASKMALKRLLEYEDTGLTPPEIMKLKERDTAVLLGNIMCGKKKGDLRFGTCPKCKRRITDVEGGNFCQNCGQRIKWRD